MRTPHVITTPESLEFSHLLASSFGLGSDKDLRAHVTFRVTEGVRIVFILVSKGEPVCTTGDLSEAVEAYNALP